MLKYLVLSLFVSFANLALANNPEYLRNLPTTFQEVNYSASTLKTYLSPLGLELINESVRINEGIAIPGMNSLVFIRTPEFIIKHVSFMAKEKSSGKIIGGSIYLAIASKTADKKLNIESFNSSAKKMKSISKFGEDEFSLILSRSYTSDSLTIDISPLDFNLL